MTKPMNPEVDLLVRAYRLILSWPESEIANPDNFIEEAGSAAVDTMPFQADITQTPFFTKQDERDDTSLDLQQRGVALNSRIEGNE